MPGGDSINRVNRRGPLLGLSGDLEKAAADANRTRHASQAEYRETVDTIIAWGEEILAYHTSRRASNGPLEGIKNLPQVLRRVAHGFTNHDNYTARGILVT